MAPLTPALLVVLLLVAGCCASSDTATGGDVCKEYKASRVAFDYSTRGEDWVTNAEWKCGGKRQSPVDYLSDYRFVPVNSSASAQLGSPNVSHAGVLNLPQWQIDVLGNFSSNGLAVPVCNGSDVGCLKSPGMAPKLVNATIVNLHWHTPSEHTLDGTYFALESHLVTKISQADVPSCPKTGCLVVWGVWYRISNKQTNNTFLEQFQPYINMTGAGCTPIPSNKTINLADGFPKDRTYVTYSGSLTTPPCTEGVTWISFQTPLELSNKQLLAVSDAMSKVSNCVRTPQGQACSPVGFQSDSRITQDLNDRQLQRFSQPSSTQSL